MSSQIVVTIEMGTYRLSGVIMDCSRSKHKLLARAVAPSFGIKCGVIKNARSFSKSIFQLITKLENNSNQPIKKVNLSISGCSIRSFYVLRKFDLNSSSGELTKEDIKFFTSECLQTFYMPDLEILEYYPIEFILDGRLVDKPIGMIGKELMIRLHIIGCEKAALDNLVYNLSQSHLSIQKILPSLLVSGYSFLSPEEMKNGTLIIDLGESTTTIGFFLDGNLIYIKSLDIGVSIITENIFNGLGMASLEEARVLQTKHAEAADMSLTNGEELIYINSDQAVTNKELSELVINGLDLIFREVLNDIQENLIHSLIQRVYLIGGGANIMYINQYVADITNLNVKEIHYDNKSILREVPAQDVLAFLPHYGFVKYLTEHEKNSSLNSKGKSFNSFISKIFSIFGEN